MTKGWRKSYIKRCVLKRDSLKNLDETYNFGHKWNKNLSSMWGRWGVQKETLAFHFRFARQEKMVVVRPLLIRFLFEARSALRETRPAEKMIPICCSYFPCVCWNFLSVIVKRYEFFSFLILSPNEWQLRVREREKSFRSNRRIVNYWDKLLTQREKGKKGNVRT